MGSGNLNSQDGVLLLVEHPLQSGPEQRERAEALDELAEDAERLIIRPLGDVVAELREKLEGWVDPDTGKKPILRVDMGDYDRDDSVYKILVLDDAERLDELRRTLPKTITDRSIVRAPPCRWA